MPRKIHRTRRIEGPDARLFLYGNGCWSFFGDEPLHPDLASAERHWNLVRRDVWLMASRFNPPKAAVEFDGFTSTGLDMLRSTWGWAKDFPLAGILAALDEDRAAVERFRVAAPEAAREIDDLLEEWLADLDTVESEAQRINSARTDGVLYPGQPDLSSTWRFGEQAAAVGV